MPADWSLTEVEAVVTDYLDMLAKELGREPYNKSAHRRALMLQVNNRSDGSIERKHQNISAILIELGYPYIDGYKPLGNYQALLAEVVADRLDADRALAAVVGESVEEPAAPPSFADLLSRVEEAPRSAEFIYPPVKDPGHLGSRRPRINYLEREARNASLGYAGEEFVLRFERERLLRLDRGSLADRVEHVAVTAGDGAGFDILSYERDGSDRFIEVKTTAYGKQTPFFVTRNELAVSRGAHDRYHLYRLFRFREDPRLYSINGALDRICRLEPIQFSARPR